MSDAPHLLRRRDGSRVPLPSEGRLVLGTSRKRAQLVLTGEGIDAIHAAILKESEGGWSLQDLGSASGTFVNGERVERVRLWTGDVIQVGDEALKVVDPVLAQGGTKAAPEPESPGGGPPRKLAGFVLEKRLGTGGMGEVWLARQESLDRPVALKLLTPALAGDEAFVRRFQEEARAAAALSHPNVVVVYDVGSADGYHFLAMEYMPGGSLEDEVSASGPLAWPQAVQALRDCAAGLVYAEERDIVHRDVKPANLMRGSAGTVKLADLGLAVSTQGGSDGRVLGTPHFLAPEQARGGRPDHRSDLYSLGATAYRLLTARTPFTGKTSRDILRAHLTAAPEPPSAHVAGLPPALDALVLELLAKDPGERPPTAAAVHARLDTILRGAGEPGRGAAGKLVAGVALLGLAGFAAWYFGLRDGDEPEDPAGTQQAAGAGGTGAGGAAPPDDDPTPPPDEDETFFEGDGGTNDGGEDVERALEARDIQAQVALAALGAELAPARELEELRAIAERYAGTPTAAGLATRIRSLEAQLAAEASAEADRERGVDLARNALSQAIGWPPAPTPEGALPTWDVGETLRALFATARRTTNGGAPAEVPDETPPPDDDGQAAAGEEAADDGTVLDDETTEALATDDGATDDGATDDGATDDGETDDDAEGGDAITDESSADAAGAGAEDALAAGEGPQQGAGAADAEAGAPGQATPESSEDGGEPSAAVQPSQEDPSIRAARALLADEVVARALADYRPVPDAIDAALDEARFEAARAAARESSARLQLPERPAGPPPAGWDELVSLAATLSERAAGIEAEIQARRDALSTAGRSELAALLGPAGGARAQLAAADWPELRARLESFADAALAPVAKQRARRFAAELATAEGALALLRRTLAADEWRRHSASLPVAGRERLLEITAIADDGLRATDDGPERLVPWSEVLVQPEVVEGLFRQRFTRTLEPDEGRAVVTLLRLSASLRAAALARQVLDPASESILSNNEAEELDAVFEPAREAAEEADALPADDPLFALLAREADAAVTLRRALEAFQESRWTPAAAGLERLLRDDADLWIVVLLSDGEGAR